MVQSVHRWSSVSRTDPSSFAANTALVPSVAEHVQREKSPISGRLRFMALRCFFSVLRAKMPIVKACYLNSQVCSL